MESSKSVKILLLVAAGLLLAIAAAASSEPKTQIVKYVPKGPGSGVKEGHCWTESIAIASRPDAWRCMAGNEIFDPCFELPGGGGVLCNPNPARKEPGIELKLTEPLPKRSFLSGQAAETYKGGWLVELDDGTTCNPVTGAGGLVEGKALTYYCESPPDASVVLLDDFDTRKPLWMAEKAALSPKSNKPKPPGIKRVPVKTVWQ